MSIEVDTPTSVTNNAMEASRSSNNVASKAMAVAVMETTTGAVAVSDNKTHIEESNHANLRSIVGCTDAIIATSDSIARAKM